jgi:hypothetical protein
VIPCYKALLYLLHTRSLVSTTFTILVSCLKEWSHKFPNLGVGKASINYNYFEYYFGCKSWVAQQWGTDPVSYPKYTQVIMCVCVCGCVNAPCVYYCLCLYNFFLTPTLPLCWLSTLSHVFFLCNLLISFVNVFPCPFTGVLWSWYFKVGK